MAKHEKLCVDNQHVFKSFAFDTFDFLALEAVDLLQRVQMLVHNKVVSPRIMNIIFKKIDFSNQKVVAAQLVA